ncbi:MAG: DNA mismatch repair protein MutS, partial [Mesorhizobium sp.]
MTRRIDRLSEDDRVLWNLVARTAKPLKGKSASNI